LLDVVIARSIVRSIPLGASLSIDEPGGNQVSRGPLGGFAADSVWDRST
jgi:hypothetical protein